MKRKLLGFTKSIVALRSFATMLLFISAFTVGWGDNYLIWKSQSASTWTESSLGSSDEVTITLEANVSYEFYLKDGSSNLWKFSNDATIEITGGTGYTLVQNTNGYNGTITNAAAGNYKFKPAWNNGKPTLTVTFPSSGGGSESNFKLMMKNNITGSEAGTEVAKFTGTNYPYTATYDITTAGTYYFYVNDGTKDYLNSGKLTFSDGTECTLYKYGDTNNQYDHAITLNAQTTGTYTFTFSQSGDNYSLKCDYPSTSSTTYYLVGEAAYFGGWDKSSGKAFTNGEVSVDVSSTNSAAQFKILKSDGKTWYGSTSTVTSSATSINLSTSVSGNAHINLDRTGTYIFKMTENGDGTIKLDVTYPTVTATVPTNLKFQSDAEDGWASKNMTSSDDNKTWTYTLDMAGMNKEVVWFRFIDATNTNACVLANSNGVEVPADGNAHNVAYLKSSSTTHNFKFYTTGATKYTIVATQVNETNWSVTITPSGEKTSYVLNCSNASYSPSQSGDVYTFTLPKSAYTSNLSFNIAKTSSTTTTYLGASSNMLTGHNNEAFTITSEDNSTATNFTYTASSVTDVPSGDITVTYDANGKTLKLYYVSQEELLNKSYYVVFPDANVGNTERADKTVILEGHTAFRLIPSRNRNAKILDEDLLSINLKIDGGKGRQLRYDTDGKIKFYITDGKGKYLKKTDFSGTEDNLSATKNANNGVDGYVTRDGSVSDNKPSYYYTISETNAIDAKSLTFMFSTSNRTNKDYIINSGEKATTIKEPSNSVDGFGTDAGMKSGNLIVGFLTTRGHGSNYYTDHISNGVYLVGKMNGEKYTRDKNYPMKQILYPLGMTDEAAADSIVYSCTVKKGSANWDDFFLSFSTGDKVEDGDNLWNLLLRPSVQNQMDGQALEGGVTFFKNDNGTDNAQQALNPLLSDAQKNRYVSYTIYFNATYSTYRIEFHDGFYIAGAAVSESGSYAPDKRIAMSSAELNGVQHYTYTGEFKNGEQFAFFLNEDSYAVNYCEDNQPVASTSATDAWNVQAPTDGKDYAFYNHVLYNENGDNDEKNLGTGKSGMTWGLPTGTYTIRFYNHKEAKNNNQLYTVDKEVTMAHVTSTFKDSENASVETVHNYGGWRTLSDDCALILPYGIKAYYAAKVGNGKVYLKELKEGYIPAHCPVILSNPNLLARSKNIAFPVCPDDYAKKLANTETNYLVDCYKEAGTVDPVVTGEDSKTKYNYFFSYRFKFEGSRVMSDVPLGFWKPFAGTATKKNYSYLSIDTELNPSRYDEDTYTFEYSDTEPVVSTKAYCFRMVFDEDDLDDNTTTGIEKVTDNADVDMKNAVWYNMQGVRISKPAAPGMYICNGKKIVVR